MTAENPASFAAPEATGAGRRRAQRSRRRAKGLGADTAERVSAGCYGALVSASTLIGLDTAKPLSLVLIVVITNVLYYATHVFAFTIGDSADTKLTVTQSITHHLRVSAPIVLVAFVPLVVTLVLLAFGVEQQRAVIGGVITAVIYLASVATTGGHLRGLRPLAVVGIAAATALVAFALVAAKLSLH